MGRRFTAESPSIRQVICTERHRRAERSIPVWFGKSFLDLNCGVGRQDRHGANDYGNPHQIFSLFR